MASARKTKRRCECIPKDLPNVPLEVEESVCEAGGLEGIALAVPGEKALIHAARTHGALSDLMRLRILYSLARCSLCPCLLKEITGLADSKLSYHLAVLEDAGLIRSTSVKRWRVYLITDEGRRQVGTTAAGISSAPNQSK